MIGFKGLSYLLLEGNILDRSLMSPLFPAVWTDNRLKAQCRCKPAIRVPGCICPVCLRADQNPTHNCGIWVAYSYQTALEYGLHLFLVSSEGETVLHDHGFRVHGTAYLEAYVEQNEYDDRLWIAERLGLPSVTLHDAIRIVTESQESEVELPWKSESHSAQ